MHRVHSTLENTPTVLVERLSYFDIFSYYIFLLIYLIISYINYYEVLIIHMIGIWNRKRLSDIYIILAPLRTTAPYFVCSSYTNVKRINTEKLQYTSKILNNLLLTYTWISLYLSLVKYDIPRSAFCNAYTISLPFTYIYVLDRYMNIFSSANCYKL